MNCAIFPLPVFVLPEGYTKLRIFEPRYLEMVSEALKNEHGFVLCQFDKNSELNVPEDGVYVEVVDFSQDESGQLLIDVYANYRVTISSPYQDHKKLRYGHIVENRHPLWADEELQDPQLIRDMGEMLSDVFNQNPHIDELYREKRFDDAIWVTSRWLELMPLNIEEKQKLCSSVNFDQVVDFIHTVLYQQQ